MCVIMCCLHCLMIQKKSKDNLQVRKDLCDMGVRQDAWPDENDKFQPAKFTLTKKDKDIFLATLKSIKVS